MNGKRVAAGLLAAISIVASGAMAQTVSQGVYVSKTNGTIECNPFVCRSDSKAYTQTLFVLELSPGAADSFNRQTQFSIDLDDETELNLRFGQDPTYFPGKNVVTLQRLAELGGLPGIANVKLEWNQSRMRVIISGSSATTSFIPKEYLFLLAGPLSPSPQKREMETDIQIYTPDDIALSYDVELVGNDDQYTLITMPADGTATGHGQRLVKTSVAPIAD